MYLKLLMFGGVLSYTTASSLAFRWLDLMLQATLPKKQKMQGAYDK
jgi:hypothetical protein